VKRSAIIAFDGQCRLELLRVWEPMAPRVAWLMLNPSTADGESDDQTILRCIHFSRKLGAGSLIVVNLLPWRATDPADLHAALKQGRISNDMLTTNLASVGAASLQSQFHIAAFGSPHRDFGWHRSRALERFSNHADQLLCLGTTSVGWPLHPLARGKFAIRNEVEPRRWERPE
jgi:hypothetical protein